MFPSVFNSSWHFTRYIFLRRWQASFNFTLPVFMGSLFVRETNKQCKKVSRKINCLIKISKTDQRPQSLPRIRTPPPYSLGQDSLICVGWKRVVKGIYLYRLNQSKTCHELTYPMNEQSSIVEPSTLHATSL